MGKRILITGGAGFIGSHLADELLSHGYSVRILDSLCEQVHGPSGERPLYLDPEAELVRLLDYTPGVTFEQGVCELAEWLEGENAVDRVEEAGRELVSRGLSI